VYVGTMRCAEAEAEDSASSVAEQDGIELTHHVVSDLPEIDAHRELYGKWNEAKATRGYDMFVQVDADTVIAHKRVLFECWRALTAARAKNFTSIQAPLHDYLTDSYVLGLNCYSTDVVFLLPGDNLYCDRSTQNNRTLGPAGLPDCIKPAGLHSPRPSLPQAFHFGVHRGLKNQHQIRKNVLEAYKRDPSKSRGVALLGFHESPAFAKHRKFCYSDAEFQDALEYVLKNYDRLIATVVGGTP
jgi:hypothetical protein